MDVEEMVQRALTSRKEAVRIANKPFQSRTKKKPPNFYGEGKSSRSNNRRLEDYPVFLPTLKITSRSMKSFDWPFA